MREVFLKQKRGNLLTAFLLLSIFGCSSLKREVTSKNIYSFLITDFYKTYKSDISKYQYFSLSSYNLDNSAMVIYNIAPEYNKVVLGSEGDAYYPKDYIEFKNNIFFIEGEITNKPSEKVFAFLKEKNLIDSAMYKLEQNIITYEDLKGTEGKILTKSKTKVTTYIVCKKNNKIINKWRTNKSEISAKNIEKAYKNGCK